MYQAMVQRGVRPSIATFGTLITAASDAGDLDAVQLVSASGHEQNASTVMLAHGAKCLPLCCISRQW